MTLLDRVTALLDREGVPHALIGAAALASVGIARSTFDLDLLVVADRVLSPSMWSDFDDASVEIRTGGPDDPLRGVIRIDSRSERPVDVIVGRHPWQAHAIARAARTGSGPAVVLPRDLVLLKLYAGGTQDVWDVRELLRVCGKPLEEEVEADLAGMSADLRAAWDRVRG